MHTPNLADENFKKLAALFPNAVTETMGDDGKVVRAIDADVLRQEISATVVEGSHERYQFTWPDKKKSVVLANQPIAKTLRLDRAKSVGRDGTPGNIDTDNIYIEGDNLDALKLLQETYLGKIKMIYIDPPYNTGNDFIYNDEFKVDGDDWSQMSGDYDDNGNRMVPNSNSNGRFHTDWLNMIYPRLKIAKDLLSDDGVIFISIDDNELENLKKLCNEVFGEQNFATQFIWTKTSTPPSLSHKCRKTVEYVLCYEKRMDNTRYFGSLLSGGDVPLLNSGNPIKELVFPAGSVKFNFVKKGTISSGAYEKAELIDNVEVANGTNINEFRMKAEFKWGQPMLNSEVENGTYFIIKTDKLSIRFQRPYDDSNFKTPNNFLNLELDKEIGIGTNESAVKELEELKLGKLFDFPKPTSLVKYLINMIAKFDRNAIILDFFSGSATTAHAVMQLNAEDGGHRKFILVQLPEVCATDSKAYRAGCKTICDIGEERIRRAGRKILDERNVGVTPHQHLHQDGQLSLNLADMANATDRSNQCNDLDIGFRVFRVDSTNMRDVYYNPREFKQGELQLQIGNIKPDRTHEDLLVQVMLDMGIMLSSKIEMSTIDGKRVFSVADGYLIACFDDALTDDTVKAIAQKKPYYAVFRDSSMASDSVLTNFEQIFATYSPKTVRKVI